VVLAWLTAIIAYTQLVLGAQIRHIPLSAAPGWFDAVVSFHLVNAAVLLGHVTWLWLRCRRTKVGLLSAPAAWLAAFVAGQIALGGTTWVVNFGWPRFLQDRGLGAGYVVQAQSITQAVVTTAHVAMGSLILALSVLVALRVSRLAWAAAQRPANKATDDSRTTARRAAAASAAPARAMELAT
jgi:cytochrome c oxidase assembly protein subunit 15